MLKSLVREIAPQRLRFLVKKAYFSAVDSLSGRGAPPTEGQLQPPRSLNFAGDGDFNGIGQEFFEYFKQFGRIDPQSAILDVGCGVGRMAVPLTGFLGENGRYEGFDIVSEGITWCNENIAKRYPNFRFQRVDLFNSNYNPRGSILSSDFKFPFSHESFDFVFLTSVFTHLLPADLRNYVGEIARVLKPGRRALMTFFLLNDRSLSAMEQGKSSIDFCYVREGYRTRCKTYPEDAIAYDEKWVLELLASLGLRSAVPLQYGSWSGAHTGRNFQDIIVVEK